MISKKVIFSITFVIISATLVSVLYQSFMPKSRTKLINEALDNCKIVKLEDKINGKICDITKEHDFMIYIFCNYKKGYYFSFEKNDDMIDSTISEFIRFGETRMLKELNNPKVFFVNKLDTLVINYVANQKSRVLENGKISK